MASRQAAEPATALPAPVSRATKHRHKGDGAVKTRPGLFESLTAGSHPQGPVEDSQNHVACGDRAEEPRGFFFLNEVKLRAELVQFAILGSGSRGKIYSS